MFNSPYLEDALAQIKQQEIAHELKTSETSETIWSKGRNKYKKIPMLAFLMTLVWLVLH